MSSAMFASPLPPLSVDGRRTRFLHALADGTDVDAFVVTNLVNVRWLTGFTGSAGFLVVTPDDMVLVTDRRYEIQAAQELADAQSDATIVISIHEQRERAAAIVGGAQRVGLEAEHVSWDRQRTMQDSWFPNARLVATTGIVDHLRRRKDAAELARIERAADITDAALAEVLPLLKTGITEREFGVAFDSRMRDHGATDPAFETIVASGPNGARPHHQPGDRRIGTGELVVIDCGSLVEGYRSDMTRTVLLGEPTETQARMFDVVVAAQQAGVERAAVGVRTADVDLACRDIITDAGWGEAFSHGTGHGVGLDIHERPRVGKNVNDVLSDHDVFTVEPGVYLPDHGGVRIEDTVVVTDDGARRLTKTPKVLTPDLVG